MDSRIPPNFSFRGNKESFSIWFKTGIFFIFIKIIKYIHDENDIEIEESSDNIDEYNTNNKESNIKLLEFFDNYIKIHSVFNIDKQTQNDCIEFVNTHIR